MLHSCQNYYKSHPQCTHVTNSTLKTLIRIAVYSFLLYFNCYLQHNGHRQEQWDTAQNLRLQQGLSCKDTTQIPSKTLNNTCMEIVDICNHTL